MQQATTTVAGIGIDVSGAKLDLAVRFSNLSYLDGSFDNNVSGIKSLLSVLKRQETARAVPLVIESTGNCHLQSALMIKQRNYSVKVINPVLTKKFQKSSVRNAKSDKIDARRLADIAVLEADLPDFTANTDVIASKKLASYLSHLEKTKQQLLASLKQLRQTTEILKINVNLKPIDKALDKIDEQIKVLQMALVKKLPEKARQLAMNTKGVSMEKIAVLISLVDGKKFENRNQLIAFVGLDIALRQSGSWRGKQKLSKRGNAYARKILYQIAWGLKQHNQLYRDYYNRLRLERKKHYNTAMVATARKFLRYLFAYYFNEQNV